MNLNFKKVDVLLDREKSEKNYEEIIVEPLERGFGVTIGNTLRRILLSSMPGAAVIGFHIDGVNHELMSIDGTSNDTLELISSLKKLRFSMEAEKDQTLVLNIDGPGQYFAKDLILPENISLKTPNILLLNATGKKKMQVELLLRKSHGDVQARKHLNVDEKFVQVDGLFSPIKKVGYEVLAKIVEGVNSHEKVLLKIETDGSISGKEAISVASSIAEAHFASFRGMEEKKTDLEVFEEKEKERISINNTTIEELELSVRSTNALKKAGIDTVGKLRKMNETQLRDLKNMGITSVEEVKEKLKKMKVKLGDYQ